MFILQNQYTITAEIRDIVFELLRVLILCIFSGVSRSQFHFDIIYFPYFRSSLFQGSIIFPHCIALPLPHPSLVLFRHRLILVVSSVFTPKNPLLHSKYHTGNCLSMHCIAFSLTAISSKCSAGHFPFLR